MILKLKMNQIPNNFQASRNVQAQTAAAQLTSFSRAPAQVTVGQQVQRE